MTKTYDSSREATIPMPIKLHILGRVVTMRTIRIATNPGAGLTILKVQVSVVPFRLVKSSVTHLHGTGNAMNGHQQVPNRSCSTPRVDFQTVCDA